MIEDYENTILMTMGIAAIDAAKAHAIAMFPNESCGFIAGKKYVACENVHVEPDKFFTINDKRYDRAVASGKLKAVVHSHPNGPLFPSHADMQQQIAGDVPWVIITLNETGVHKMIAWGDSLPIAPVISRPFIHGVFDCYSMARDIFRLGRTALKLQGVDWPLEALDVLPAVPRGDAWWKDGEDLYQDYLGKVGFKIINRVEAQAGDCFLLALGDRTQNPHKRLNHAGVLLEHDQILHQLPTDISRRIPASIWANAADLWIRYEGSAK